MRTRTVILPKLSSKLMVCLSSKIRTSYIWTQDSCNWNLPTLRRGIFCFYGHFLLPNPSSGLAACSIKTQKAFFSFFSFSSFVVVMCIFWFLWINIDSYDMGHTRIEYKWLANWLHNSFLDPFSRFVKI